MKIIKPDVFVNFEGRTGDDILRKIEKCGRICYRSEPTGDPGDFVRRLIARGHESVLEHVSVTAYITCDRGVTHELVRHRVASYSQESTRYCNYCNGKFGCEIAVIEPLYLKPGSRAWDLWEEACEYAEYKYMAMRDRGCTPQEARAVLPNSTAAKIAMTANLREWRHILKLRTSKAAHPQMQEIANMILSQMKEHVPVVFDDVKEAEQHGSN